MIGGGEDRPDAGPAEHGAVFYRGMSLGQPLRVAVALPEGPAVRWHRAVVDAIRDIDGVDVVDRGEAVEAVIDLAGVGHRGADPPLGVWRYGFGDGALIADGAAGTWARLYRVTPDPGHAIVLHEGWYRARTADAWGTRAVGDRVAPWCARVLKQIQLGDQAVVCCQPQATAGCRDPTPAERPMPLGRAGADGIDMVRSWLTRQRWTIGIVPVGIDEILQRGRLPEPTWIGEQPADRFYADPFPLAVSGGRARVLAEEYRYPSRAKRIVHLEIGRSGDVWRSHQPASLPRHASYPFVLSIAGAVYCIPETGGAGRVSAFRHDAASGCWTHERDLLSGFPAIDATLLERDGCWWMFCTKQGDEDQTDLHLFSAPAWTGPWEPHPLNPVKSDTRSSRPAGACFTRGGVVYRPAQNCARRYGAGITINRIVDLSTRAFREEPVLSLPPPASAWPHGMHTINSVGDWTIVDGLRVEQRWGPASLHRRKG